ncbi:hypothetical protein IWW34DRAFT_639361, partial [Fusarium oxysporum f. sp. albedinis]
EQSEAQAVAARLTSSSTTRLTTSSFPTISPSITPTTTKSPPNRTHIIRTSPHSLAAGERSSVERILPDKIPEIPRTLEQAPQCSATVDKLNIQQMPRHTQLPGIMQVASRWPQPLSDRILRQLATKSIDAISSGPEDFKIGGPREIYYCPLCSNKKRFLQDIAAHTESNLVEAIWDCCVFFRSGLSLYTINFSLRVCSCIPDMPALILDDSTIAPSKRMSASPPSRAVTQRGYMSIDQAINPDISVERHYYCSYDSEQCS